MQPKKVLKQKDQDQIQDLKDHVNYLKDRIEDLEHALEFIHSHASRPNIWYAAVADAALQGDGVEWRRK